jgi:hypothetical protein
MRNIVILTKGRGLNKKRISNFQNTVISRDFALNSQNLPKI